MRLSVGALILIMMMTIGGMGCDEALSDLTGPTPNLAPTFSSISREIFQTTDSSGRLACVQCHNEAGRTFTAGLSLQTQTAYAELVGVASRQKPGLMRVAPGDPENSYLIHKLEGRADIVGLRMPRNTGPFLTEGQMSVIRRWIQLGARND
jgi:hypothetical protein